MGDVATFWCEPTEDVYLSLRRFTFSSDVACPLLSYGHNATIKNIERVPHRLSEEGYLDLIRREEFEGDERWPVACECGYEFEEGDQWQVSQEPIYAADDGREWGRRELPPGAMYDSYWMPDSWRGPDGLALTVILPNGQDWVVDSTAGNCTRRGGPHQCWVRHGDPRTEPVTVGKDGDTCSAGGGSILSGDYHGFLRNSVLIDA